MGLLGRCWSRTGHIAGRCCRCVMDGVYEAGIGTAFVFNWPAFEAGSKEGTS
ncbi:MAG: hypothetical protein JXQ73_06410 [Phycisphaerae bacterium]|nr:hypothetical protein [Phycisphaerae bacterium]